MIDALKRFECRACKNWRTTLAGVGSIMAALADLIAQLTANDWDVQRVGADLAGLFTGVGLLFARDSVVSEREHAEDRTAIVQNTESAVIAKQVAVDAAKEAVSIRNVVEEHIEKNS